jgi:hypothetical protein
MLEQCHAGNVTDATWDTADKITRLTIPEVEFLAHAGATPPTYTSRRSYHRFYFRGKGLLVRRRETLGVYTTDLSRKGLGLLSPIQLFPMERVKLQLSDGRECQLEIVRCRRLDRDCYECGSRFVVGLRLNEIVAEERE